MHKTREAQIDLFMKHVGYWSWIHVLYLYDESHLLIADEWFIDRVRKARPAALKCQTARPDAYETAITADIKKVLVFCAEGELALVRKLQAEYPAIQTVSGTYGFACVGKDRYPRLKEFQEPFKGAAVKPTFILSTPYADAEFVTSAMTHNGMPPTVEYLARPFSTWLAMQKNFQISRFYNTVRRHYVKDGALSWHMQTDVLQALFQHSAYSLKRFARDLKRLDANVIFVSRGGQWAQAVTAQLLHRTGERSVWTKSPKKKIKSVREQGDLFGCLEWEEDIRAGDACLKELESLLPQSLHINLEEFIKDQTGSLQKIANFTGASLGEAVEPLDYAAGYETAADIPRLITRLQRELIDRLGLHVRLPVLEG